MGTAAHPSHIRVGPALSHHLQLHRPSAAGSEIRSGMATAEQILHRDFYQNRDMNTTELKPGSAISPDGSRTFTVALSTSFLLTPLLSSGAETPSQVSMILNGFSSETEQSTKHAATLVRITIKD